MTLILSGVLIAGLLHVVCAGIAKFGDKNFDNRRPREWGTTLTGYRARANAAQANTVESLPLFFIAVALALYTDAPVAQVQTLMVAWLIARLGYIWFYVRDKATLRSIIWVVALVINALLLFSGNS